jgi:uncharacterized protein YdeI (YjbR/CyaY-like superfamily)
MNDESELNLDFVKKFHELPERIKKTARKNYSLWKNNPSHSSLKFKEINAKEQIWSVTKMDIANTVKLKDRSAWRDWLDKNHQALIEIWLLFDNRPEHPTVSYLDAVEEAICFGWIDGIQKRLSIHELAQRFTPRKKRSKWTELNKERARRLIRLGLMTDAGSTVLPDLNAEFIFAGDIIEVLKAEPDAWSNFLKFPELYRRVRIGYIEEVRKNRTEFERRLQSFVGRTARNKMFGNWNDGGKLL